MTDETPDLSRLRDEVHRLYGTLVHWTPSRWAGRAADGRSRADVVFALVTDLAVLGARAGCGAPAGAAPSRLGSHALADQLLVVAAELLTAPAGDEVAADA